MKSLEDLGDYYTSMLLPDLQGLEAERQLIQKRLLMLGGGVAAAFLATYLYYLRDHKQWPVVVLTVILLGLAAAGGYVVIVSSYTQDFKAKIIKRLIAFIDPGLEYVQNFCVDEGILAGSGFFKQWPDQYSGQDYIGGTIGQTKIQFSEVDAQYETVSERGEKIPHGLFKGLFYVTDFNKPLQGMTFVFPDTAKGLLGEVLGRAVQAREHSFGELIALENPDFDRQFVVYSSNPVEARYILTPAMMERLLKYRWMSGEAPWVSFVGKRIHFAIPEAGDYFAPSIFGPIVDFADVVKYYGRIKMVTRLVDDLHLNTRVWTVQ